MCSDFERRAASRFFGRVIRPQDRAAVFSVSTDVVVLQEFTNKVPLLSDATRQLQALGATSFYDGIYLAADYLKAARGRRVIVIVSDGGDTTSNKSLLEALAQAQKSDAIIFAVFTGNPWPSQNLRDLAAERALETLTGETGGEVLKPKLPLFKNGSRHGEETDEISLKELDQWLSTALPNNCARSTSSASTRPTKNATALSANSACESKSPVTQLAREPVTMRLRIEGRERAAPRFFA